jgi:hypothetical protein
VTASLVVSKEIGLEVNVEKTEYVCCLERSLQEKIQQEDKQ